MNLDINKTLKSKTIRGIIIVAIAILMQMYAIKPAEIQDVAPTIDEISIIEETQPSNTLEFGTRIVEILGLLYAAYGRAVAQQPLTKKKEGESNETP